MKNKELIAYQSVDPEGDIWNNIALLFEDNNSALKFFSNPKLVINTIGFEVKEFEDIDNCIQLIKNGESLYCAIIRLEYCGECKFLKMSRGYIIE